MPQKYLALLSGNKPLPEESEKFTINMKLNCYYT